MQDNYFYFIYFLLTVTIAMSKYKKCWVLWSYTLPTCTPKAKAVAYGIKYIKESHMETRQCFAISLCAALGRKMDPEVTFHKAGSKDTHLTISPKVS